MTPNPPAFPFQHMLTDGASISTEGMTLLDYFAGQAIAGYCANQEFMKNAVKGSGLQADACVAIAAYEVAAAALTERARVMGEGK